MITLLISYLIYRFCQALLKLIICILSLSFATNTIAGIDFNSISRLFLSYYF